MTRHWFHKWSNWSEKQRDTEAFFSGNLYQMRICKTCGYIQRRWL